MIRGEPAYSFNKFLLDLIDSEIPITEYKDVEVSGFIGAGATMAVCEGTWRKELVAIKSFTFFNSGSIPSDSENDLDFQEKLRSASLEVRVMSSDKIRKCRNIITLLAASWKEDPEDDRVAPLLIVELANYKHRTLEEAIPSLDAFEIGLKSHLIWGIVNGLRELHFNGVIHGDLKPENVLLFEDKSSRYPIPKLSDFGFCQADSLTGRAAGGTEYWLPPQCIPISSDLLQSIGESHKTGLDRLLKDRTQPARDIYSFGLVAFTILLGRKIFGNDRGLEYGEIQQKTLWNIKASSTDLITKMQDDVNAFLRLVDKDSKVVEAALQERPSPAGLKSWREMIRLTSNSAHLDRVEKPEVRSLLESYFSKSEGIAPRNDNIDDELRNGNLSWQVFSSRDKCWKATLGTFPVEILYLAETLNFTPEERYEAVDWTEWLRPLDISGRAFKHKLDPLEAFQGPNLPATSYRGNKNVSEDYQSVVPSTMWPSAVSQLIKDASAFHSSPWEKFLVADCYIGGNGVKSDLEEALRWILKALHTAKNDEEARQCRSAFLRLYYSHYTPDIATLVPAETEITWLLEYLRAPHLGDVEEFLLEFSRKLRRDMVTAIGHDNSFHLLRALFCVGNGGQRDAIFYEAGHKDRAPLASHLLGGVPKIAELLPEMHQSGSAFELLDILSEKLFRQMAASSSGLTFDILQQSMSQMLPFAGKTLKLVLGSYQNDEKILIGCDVADHAPHELLPVLFSAMASENWSTFHWLLRNDRGKELIESRWRKQSALFYAVMIRNPLFVTALISCGADPNDGLSSPEGHVLLTPLVAACGKSTFGVPFEDEDLEPSNCFFSMKPLFLPLKVGEKDHDDRLRQRWIVQALVTAERTDVNLKGFTGIPALEIAIRAGDEVMVKALLGNGANVSQVDTCLIFLALREEENYLEILRLLVEHGADVDCRCPDGSTSLLTACVVGLPKAAKLLLELGANPSASHFRSYTPLHVAALKCHKDIIASLVAYGADREARADYAGTPFEVCLESSAYRNLALSEKIEIFKLLWPFDEMMNLEEVLAQTHLE